MADEEGFESHLFRRRLVLVAVGMSLVINAPFPFERILSVYEATKEAQIRLK